MNLDEIMANNDNQWGQTWGGENIFYKNAPAFNPCIDCFLFTYQKLEKNTRTLFFWHKKCLKHR